MTSKGKSRTPPDLMSELLSGLQEDVPLPGERRTEAGPPRPKEQQVTETAEQQVAKTTERLITRETERLVSKPAEQLVDLSIEQLVDLSTERLVDLSTRPQDIKTQTRKRDGIELTRKTHYLTPDQARALKEYAFMTGQGESEVVRQALDEFFVRHGRRVWGSGE